MIRLHIYNKLTGRFQYSDSGPEDYIFLDMPEDCDFTLLEPPNSYEAWRWIDSKWTTDDTA